MSDEITPVMLRITFITLAVLIMLHSTIIATRPLLGVRLIALLFAAYLAWRGLSRQFSVCPR